jgi:GNAT superfamily N-acetyltransferase
VRIVPPEELLKAAGDPDLDLDPAFVRDALARGDMAFGAFESDRLVGYTWRTFTAAPDRDGLWARVGHPYQYSYKAFTRPSHRRKRIHVAITAFADACLLRRGYAFEVGYMEIDNFASIGVADFLGRRKIGYAGYVKWFGRSVPFRTPAVKKIGAELFRLQV